MRQAARHLAAVVITFLACASASAAVVATNSVYALIDGRAETRTLKVIKRGLVTDVNITVEFSKCDDPPIGPAGTACIGRSSPFENEFGLVLFGPDGQSVTLVQPFATYSAGTGGGAGRVSVTFDDEAMRAPGPRVQAGSFRPAESLALLDGMDLFGSWTLYLRDYFRSDPLEFFSASLDIAYEPVPEPATLAILGLGLGLMGMRARRR